MKLNEAAQNILSGRPGIRPDPYSQPPMEPNKADSHMIKPNEYGNINIPDSGYIKNVVVNGKRLTARQFAFNPKTSTLVIDRIVFSKQ